MAPKADPKQADELRAGPEPTWFTVKYGEDLCLPFNADCCACVLVDHIKAKCGYGDAPETFDLLQESGAMVELGKLGTERATAVLAPKGVYLLCRFVPGAEDGSPPTVETMWTPPEGQEAPRQSVTGDKKKR